MNDLFSTCREQMAAHLAQGGIHAAVIFLHSCAQHTENSFLKEKSSSIMAQAIGFRSTIVAFIYRKRVLAPTERRAASRKSSRNGRWRRPTTPAGRRNLSRE